MTWPIVLFDNMESLPSICAAATFPHLFAFVSPQVECQNYIRVLLVNKTEVMTCGTNAFQPLCITREVTVGGGRHRNARFDNLFDTFPTSSVLHLRPQVGNMSSVLERVNGVARCPYDPRHNSTAVVTESGELYAATVIDFSGLDPVIYRSLGGMPPLRTAQYNSKWLNGKVAPQRQFRYSRVAALILFVFRFLYL